MKLTVIAKELIAADTMQIRLSPHDEERLPCFEPGAHIEISFAEVARRYSLTSDPATTEFYEICVLRSTQSRGGSAYLHDTLKVGESIHLIGVGNDFPLNPDAPHSIFIAGGIGITPFLTMMNALQHVAAPFELHYVVRDSSRFLPLSESLLAKTRHYTNQAKQSSLNVVELMAEVPQSAHIYVCGPSSLIEAVRTECARRGVPSERLHFETFGISAQAGDKPLTVRLAQSSITIQVEAGTPILEALLDNGVWAAHGCRRGVCGSCLAQVVSGVPIHRDFLAPQLRAGAMCTCVSWAAGPELVLDL